MRPEKNQSTASPIQVKKLLKSEDKDYEILLTYDKAQVKA